MGLAGVLMTASPARAARVLVVADLNASGDGVIADYATADQNMINHLSTLYTVTALDDSAVTPADVAASDAVIISHTTASGTVRSSLPDVWLLNKPIMNMEPGLANYLGFNTFAFGGAEQAQGIRSSLEILNNAHPVTAGVSLGAISPYTTPSMMVWQALVNPGFYDPAPGAAILARFVEPQFSLLAGGIMAVDKGALLAANSRNNMGSDFPAADKRLAFFMGYGAFTNLTADGLKLFDQGVAWLVPEPTTLALLGIGLAAAARRRAGAS
ncbi:MAG: hypothetical protein AMXMBFR83_07540 [Phycisphaerae bacterium]|jgi:hypothetical protein